MTDDGSDRVEEKTAVADPGSVAVTDRPTAASGADDQPGDGDGYSRLDRLRSMLSRGRVTMLGLALVAIVATTCAIVFGVKWSDAIGKQDRAAAQAATDAKAEKVASDYAVRVSNFDYNDLDAWKAAVTQGVTDQFKASMQGAAQLAEPILKSLQWTSTSRLMMARTTGHHDDVYTVQVFVNVSNKSLQGQYTLVTAYSVVLNKGRTDNDWVISNAANTNDAAQPAGLPTGADPAVPQPDPANPSAPGAGG
ncbi:hypothetical protein [Jongsikchunia kroppenstedtii]|uniref:hypothetical protein n=1 Tax=Jongsikchunia kroppenstedtii TaxID=1121721 RepID=UPI000368790B|nr:hypothetical protein [Jongsikchunia kroppenstedtii]